MTRTTYSQYDIPSNYSMLSERGIPVYAIATRSDGFTFYLGFHTDSGTYRIWAGCKKCWTMAQYRRHLKHYRGRQGRRKAKETKLILDLFDQCIKRPLD